MSAAKPLVLITNRFDQNLKLKLPQIREADCRYVTDLMSDAEGLAHATALITRTSTVIDQDFLHKTPKLKIIVTATSGFDHIDLNATQGAGVEVYHVPETQSVAAAELTISLLFNCARKQTLAVQQLHKGDWQRSLLLGRQIAGLTFGIIGFGRVGRAVAARAEALGMKVVIYDPFLTDEPPAGIISLGFEELMRTADAVSLHVPKTKLTRHMIKKETLDWLDSNAILINMSRGDVVNEADLIEHLVENPSFSAGLDVFAKEPLVTKSRLLSLSNVSLTPHIGASTVEALRQSSVTALDKILARLRGESVEGGLPPEAPWYEG